MTSEFDHSRTGVRSPSPVLEPRTRNAGSPSTPTNFLEILRNIWWRLDVALDEDTIHWSATLGAVEALMSGTTGIIDHHESPNFIDGSLDVISRACDAVGQSELLLRDHRATWH